MDYLCHLINLVKHWISYLGLTDKQNFEDIFYQFLHDKNYDEALKLAQQHDHLDIDLVYKCKWRNSGITVKSINSNLGKIQDKLWAINECVQTVPISYEACRTLIEFGLEEANLRLLYQLGNEAANSKQQKGADKKNPARGNIERNARFREEQILLPDDATDEDIEGLIDFENLNDQQNELCRCRQDLLRHQHSLFAYERILGDYKTVQQHFDHVFYDEFRQKCPLNVCIDYAHEGDANAVEKLLNFYTEDLRPHLLAILSNFPETLSPYHYRNLLPCLREDDLVYEWPTQVENEQFDWSCKGDANSSLAVSLKNMSELYESEFYKDDEHLKKYLKPLTADVLSEWFIERAFEIESKTLLLTSAIQLLHLGTELNIKNLQKTHDDLLEFDRIVYDCCTDNNIYLSYTEFSKMIEIDRLILITGDSAKNCKDRFRFYVIPYLHRRENQLGFKGKVKLLREFFHRLAHSREHICQPVYDDLLDRIESDDFVAEWTKDLDDVIDDIGEEIKTIARQRHANQLSTIASQTLALGDFDECYEACQLIMDKNYKECWALCCHLGMNKKYSNNEAKYKLLAFALAHCDDPDGKMSAKILDYIIELRKRDERIQLAYLQKNM